MWPLIVVLPSVLLGPPEGESLLASLVDVMPFAVVFLLAAIMVNSATIYVRTLRTLRRNNYEEAARESVFGADGCTFTGPHVDFHIRYSTIDRIATSDSAAFLELRGDEFPSILPVELVPPAAVARYLEATTISVLDDDSARSQDRELPPSP